MIKLETIHKLIGVHKIEITGRKLRLYTDKEGTQKNCIEFLAYTKNKMVHVIDTGALVRSISNYYDMIKNREMELLDRLGTTSKQAKIPTDMKDVYPSITKFIFYLEQELNCVFVTMKVPTNFESTPSVTTLDFNHIYVEDGGGTLYLAKPSKKLVDKTYFECDLGIEAKGIMFKGVCEEKENIAHNKVLNNIVLMHISGIGVLDTLYVEKYFNEVGLEIKRVGI